MIKNNYKYNDVYNVYYEDENNNIDINILRDMRDFLPKDIINLIDKNWVVVISDKCPISNQLNNVSGITFHYDKIIWIEAGSSIEVCFHEFAHAIDEMIGMISYSSEFKEIYKNNWDTYIEYGMTTINYHVISSEAEFFAALFVDYCVNPEYLKENLNEAYVFFENLFKNKLISTPIGNYFAYDVSTWRLLANMFNIHKPYTKLKHVVDDVNTSVVKNEFVVVDEYENIVEYNWVDDNVKYVIDIMMDIINNPDDYPVNKRGYYEIEDERLWTYQDYLEILNFAVMYFCDETIDPVNVNTVNGTYTKIEFNKQVILDGEASRIRSLEQVEETLQTIIHEGTDTEKLIQISEFITNKCNYKISRETSADTFWSLNTGDCMTYAMIFKQFVNRLGLSCDIVFIEYEASQHHVYNRVELSDGTYRYYDLTRNIVDNDMIDTSGFYLNHFIN
jgi:hypothetical protein